MGCCISQFPLPPDIAKEWSNTVFDGYIENPVITSDTINRAQKSWKLMLNKKSHKSTPISPVTEFYEYFYSYLFSRYPLTRLFFVDGGIQKRAHSLIRMITVALDTAERPICI